MISLFGASKIWIMLHGKGQKNSREVYRDYLTDEELKGVIWVVEKRF